MTNASLIAFSGHAKAAIDFLHGEFMKLQTGRANAALVEHVSVECYGQKMELRAVSSISVQDATTIVIQPWDRTVLNDIERALQKVNLGTSPVNDGAVLRISLPPMTEERRTQLKKVVSQLEEEAKIKIRKHRHDAQTALKDEPDEDERERGLKELQKLVDTANADIEESAKSKQDELMKV